jgi:hypothetical protein
LGESSFIARHLASPATDCQAKPVLLYSVLPEFGVLVELRGFGNGKENGTRPLLRDRASNDRVLLDIKDSTTPKLEVRDRQEKLIFDPFAKPHK